MIACELCGHLFDPSLRSGCGGCPLEPGCRIACCPACGYSEIDIEQTWTGRLAGLLARRSRTARPTAGARATLADLPRGSKASVQDLDALSAGCRERLHAYGVTPGRPLEVVQSAPVTIIRVGHLELAFEPDVAAGIRVVA